MKTHLQHAILLTLRQKAGNWLDSEDVRKSLATVPTPEEFVDAVKSTKAVKIKRTDTGTQIGVEV